MKGAVTGPLLGLLLCCAGCPAGGTGGEKAAVPALQEGSLPTAPDKLIQLADEQYGRGGAGVDNSRLALERAIQKNPDWAQGKDAYGAYWRLARAYADLSSNTDSDERRGTLSQAGIAAARKAVDLMPDQPEGHYYLAQVIGYNAMTHKGESKDMINEMVQQAERADQLAPSYDHGGPARMLGALYARAPAPPISVGDPEKAVQLLQRAQQLDPAYPANTIFLAEALLADDRVQDADATLKKAKAQLAGKGMDPAWERNRDTWNREFTRVEKRLRAKQGA